MARWFRFYDDVLNDPKVQLLEPKLFKAWVNLLCLASQHDGLIPSVTDVAFALRTSETEAGRIVDGLISAGLIDQIEERLQPHNWNERQFKSDVSTERVKRFRKRACNVSSTVSETPPDTDTDTDTDTEKDKKETRVRAGAGRGPLLSDDWPADYETKFWNFWPNKVGKAPARKALAAARKRRCSFVRIMTGIADYVRDKPPDRPWLNPTTFLNQNRWEDQPATMSARNGTTQNRPGSLMAVINREIAALEAEESVDPNLPESPVLRLSSGSIR